MAKLPLPQRGQPIDLTYISDMANAINNIASQVSLSSYKYVTVDTPTAGKQSVKTSEARIVAGYKEVVNNKTVIAGQEESFEYPFANGEFQYPPIVTVTPKNISATTAGQNISVIIQSVTTQNVKGIVRFGSNGNVSVGINLIAIGIPD